MSRTTAEITAQCDAGLISIAEARVALRLVIKQAWRDAGHCDSLAEVICRRAANARRALVAL